MSESQKQDHTSFAAFGTVMSLLTLGALVGNIICFRMTKRLIKSKPSLGLVLNLCMSDIIVAAVSWTAFMVQHIASTINFEINIMIHKLFWAILVGLGTATLFTLTGLSADCFVALRWPLHYKNIATTRSINIYIAGLWLCSIMTGAADFIAALSRTEPGYPYEEAIRESITLTGKHSKISNIFQGSITMLVSNIISFICLVVMIAMYGYIIAKIRQVNSSQTLQKQGKYKNEIQAVQTTLMIFASFLLLWLPTLVVNIISAVKPTFLSHLSFTEASFIGYSADCLLMVHSMVDALIYGIRVRKMLQRQRHNREQQADYSRAYTFKRTNTISEADNRPSELNKNQDASSVSSYNTQDSILDGNKYDDHSSSMTLKIPELVVTTAEQSATCSYTHAAHSNGISKSSRNHDRKEQTMTLDCLELSTLNNVEDKLPQEEETALSTIYYLPRSLQETDASDTQSDSNSNISNREVSNSANYLAVPINMKPLRSSLKRQTENGDYAEKEVRFGKTTSTAQITDEICQDNEALDTTCTSKWNKTVFSISNFEQNMFYTKENIRTYLSTSENKETLPNGNHYYYFDNEGYSDDEADIFVCDDLVTCKLNNSSSISQPQCDVDSSVPSGRSTDCKSSQKETWQCTKL